MRNENRHHLALHRLDNLSWHSLVILFLLVLPCLLTLTGCNHKELGLEYEAKRRIRVVYDWTKAPDANPKGMCVYFYPEEGTRGGVQRIDFTGLEGGYIDLAPGLYHIVSYNNDTEYVLFNNVENFDSHHGYTRDGDLFEPVYGSGNKIAPRAEESEEERVTISPDMLWGASHYGLTVKDEDQTITLYPEELVCHYSYAVHDVKNIKHMTQVCGSLSGLAPHVIFSDFTLGKECVTIPFATVSDRESTFTGEFLTFGHHEDNEKKHMMIFYVWMDDGSKWYYTYDVTDQVDQAPDKRHVHIIINGLDLPQPITNGSGFHPSVDDWQTEREDIIM